MFAVRNCFIQNSKESIFKLNCEIVKWQNLEENVVMPSSGNSSKQETFCLPASFSTLAY